MKSFILFFLCFISLSKAYSTELSFREVRNLKYDWLVESGEETLYYHEESTVGMIHFLINSDEINSEDILEVRLAQNHGLFLGNRLILYSSSRDEVFRLTKSELFQAGEEKVKVSILGVPLIHPRVSTKIVVEKNVDDHKSNYLQIVERSISGKANLYLTILIGIMLLLVIFRTQRRKAFDDFLSLSNFFRLNQRSDILSFSSVYSVRSLAFIFLYSLMVGGGSWVFALGGNIAELYLRWGEKPPKPYMIGVHFLLISMFLMLAKHWLLFIFSNIFNVGKISDLQFFIYLKASLSISVLVFSLLMLNAFSNDWLINSYGEISRGLLIFLILLRVLYSLLVLNKELSFHKLHLFIYLCSTELIPQIVFVKLLIK